ncbi:MAG: hypothetical protein HN377_11610 [Alphaproteobacteria bacterium]|jgi:hypothetical protein|nr:hypothetical protein [Alphaproteobacteria bacterium]
MTASLIIAQVLGPVYLVAGIALFNNPTAMHKLVAEISDNPAQSFVWGFFTLALSLLILAFHDAWTADWTVVITIMGWLGTLKGTVLMIAPGMIAAFSKMILKPAYMRVSALGALAFGVFLSVKGFGLV